MENLIYYVQPIQFIAGIILLVVATYTSQFQDLRLTKGFVTFLACAAAWCFFAGVIMEVPDLETKVWLNRFKMIAAICVPPTILQLAIDFNRSTPIARRLLWFALFTSGSFSLLALTPWHELIITDYQIAKIGPVDFLHFKSGRLFFIHNILSRVYILVALALLLQASADTNAFYRKTARLLIVSILVPFVVDTVGTFFYPPIRHMQLVPVTLALTSLFMLYALVKHRSVSLMPLARSYVFGALSSPCLVWNARGELIDVNESACRALGIDRDLRGLASFDHLQQDGAVVRFGTQIFKVKHGSIRVEHGSAGSYAVLEDITDVYNHDLVKTNLLTVLSHDIQGHIGQLGMLSETLYLERAQLSPAAAAQLTEYVYLTTQDVNFFLKDIVRWTRDQYDGWLIKPEELCLRDVVTGITGYVGALARARGVEVENAVASDAWVTADPAMLEIVIRNLLYNALKHGHRASRIRITSAPGVLRITNAGELKNLHQLNQYFSSRTETSLALGTEGLGHRLCREFLTHLGFRLQYSNADGELTAEIAFSDEAANSSGVQVPGITATFGGAIG